jgi:UDP:flavonoid glycosyltransferase YjiC (YdhE family)
MRVLFTTQPGLGHLHPLLPVAAGLRRRGHDVAFASSASFGPQVVAAGFSAFAVGQDWVAVEMVRAFPEMASIPPGPARYAWARGSIFAGATARATTPDLVDLARRWRADLIVREAAEYGGCLAAELLGLPHAMVRTDSGSSSYSDRLHVAEPLSELRHEFGLPADPDVDMPFRYLQLSFAPNGLGETDAEKASTCHCFRPIEPAVDDSAPPWLAALPQRPTVYATLGTVYNGPDLLETIIEGLATECINLVVTIGTNHDPARFGRQPAHVRIEQWIDQQVLLPHCDAVVTHGGYGTTSAALTAGLPLVFIPISADQPHNAERCAALGVGRVVGPDERTPAAIRAAARAVLADPAHRRAARAIAREAHRRPGLDATLDLLERLAIERVPLHRDAVLMPTSGG